MSSFRSTTKILAVDVGAFSRLFGWIYGALGCLNVLVVLVFIRPATITFPIGVLMPVFNLNINIHTGLPEHALDGALAALGLMICYVVSGWITGAFFGLCFNLAATHTGGIENRIFRLEADFPEGLDQDRTAK